MRLSGFAIAALAVCAATSVDAADNYPVPDPSHIIFTAPKDIKWKMGTSSDQAVIFGDPEKPGIYGILIRWHPGNFSRPHFHNTDRYAYVVSGTWWVSSSDTYDPAMAYPMPAGSVVTDLANTVHWDGAKDEDALLELVGMGPVTTTQVKK
ncbi:MAG TPA: cupin domain-containing protein [Rhizomicrobium sp.]|nr:cupin domain-containing protein [Rhizomicrobium sp.]